MTTWLSPLLLGVLVSLCSAALDEKEEPFCTGVNYYIPDPTTCGAYWFCDASGNAQYDVCNVAYSFDVTDFTCKPSYLVDCDEATGQRPRPVQTTWSPVCTHYGQTFADPNTCNGYYLCDANLTPQFGLCPPGDFYDIYTLSCLYYTSVDCNPATGERPPIATTTTQNPYVCSSVGQTFPLQGSCTEYFECDSTLTPIQHICAQNYEYSSSTGDCQPASLVDCPF